MSEPTIPEIEELIGAYALDAVDDDERVLVEQHLAVCARCRAELAEHREVAALLAYDGTPAPDELWDRIAGSLEAPPPAIRLKVDVPRRRRRWPGYLAVAAVAAAVALVLGVVAVRRDDRSGDVAMTQIVDEARQAPGSTTVTLRPPDGQSGPEAKAVVTTDGRGYLEAGDLPALPADRTYQLWGVVDDQAISLGVLGAEPDVVSFQVDDAGRIAALAVTDEHAGGVIASQNQPVVVGETT